MTLLFEANPVCVEPVPKKESPMKTSLKTRALILSLAAISLAGMGCERRGRAPTKETVNTSAKSSPTVNLKKETEAQSNTSSKTTTGEGALFELANHPSDPFKCAFGIDTAEAPNRETLEKDLVLYREYRVCQKKAGVYAAQNAILSSTVRSNGLISEGEKDADLMLKKFDALTNASNEDYAREVLAARIKLLRIASDAMTVKYSGLDPNLEVRYSFTDPDTNLKVENKGNVGAFLRDIALISESADNALSDLQKMKSIEDGRNLSKESESEKTE
jgi:hypothetical protein